MAHERPRYQKDHISNLLSASPVVGIFGHRQVGKTTLCQQLAGRSYFTLDIESTLQGVENDPLSFVAQSLATPMTIDESQYSPALFPAIKEWVRNHKRPGSFLLTGSVRFLSRKAIRESLTGRILLTELLPMSMTELEGNSPNFLILDLLKQDRWSEGMIEKFRQAPLKITNRERQFRKYLAHGGLPGIAFIRSDSQRRDQFESLIETLIERDLKLIQSTTLSRSSLFHFLTELAKGQGQPLEYSQLARTTRISVITIKKLLYAFESLYLIRILRTEGGARAPVLFFEDQGEATALQGDRPSSTTDDLIRGLWANTRPMLQFAVRSNKIEKYEFFQFRTPFKSEVPLALRCVGRELGFISLPGIEVTRAASGAARSFLNAYPNGKIIYLAYTRTMKVLSSNQMIAPIGTCV